MALWNVIAFARPVLFAFFLAKFHYCHSPAKSYSKSPQSSTVSSPAWRCRSCCSYHSYCFYDRPRYYRPRHIIQRHIIHLFTKVKHLFDVVRIVSSRFLAVCFDQFHTCAIQQQNILVPIFYSILLTLSGPSREWLAKLLLLQRLKFFLKAAFGIEVTAIFARVWLTHAFMPMAVIRVA